MAKAASASIGRTAIHVAVYSSKLRMLPIATDLLPTSETKAERGETAKNRQEPVPKRVAEYEERLR
jgi:hypothetical protein